MKYNIIILLISFGFPAAAWCAKHKPSGIGGIAENMMEPVAVISDFVTNGALIIGVSFLFAAFFRFLQYRVNPLAAPLSTVIILFLLGVSLLLLPLAYKLSL
jgi:hypothetical protein